MPLLDCSPGRSGRKPRVTGLSESDTRAHSRIQSRGAVYRRPVRAGSSQSPAALGRPPALSTAVLRPHAVKGGAGTPPPRGAASGGRAGQRQQRGPALTPPLPGAHGPPSPLPATQSHSHSLTVRGVSTSDGVVGTPRVTAALPCGRRQRPGEGSAGARGGRAIYTQFSSMRALIKWLPLPLPQVSTYFV